MPEAKTEVQDVSCGAAMISEQRRWRTGPGNPRCCLGSRDGFFLDQKKPNNTKLLEQLESCQEQGGVLRAMTLTLTVQALTPKLQGSKEKGFSLALRMYQPLKSSRVQFG